MIDIVTTVPDVLLTPKHAKKDDCRRVLVYGTLRRGHGNWKGRLDKEPLTTLPISGFSLWAVAGCGFPGLVVEEVSGVVCELYEVSDEQFTGLDQLEGYNEATDSGMYVRRYLPAHDAWIYIWNSVIDASKIEHIINGDWNDYL
jgi:gamma-glutamylcyclotransferase (GGCT)/AIG2-like uncharacterized protein YtfP